MSRFRGCFEKQEGKHDQALLKSPSHTLYHIDPSLLKKLSWEKSLLLTCKILVLLVNTLAADEKYPVLNRDNLTISIQIEITSETKKVF